MRTCGGKRKTDPFLHRLEHKQYEEHKISLEGKTKFKSQKVLHIKEYRMYSVGLEESEG